MSGWTGSNRRARLPKDWECRRQATRTRVGDRCEGITLEGEPRWHVPTCTTIGTDCDHDQPGDDHHLDNLRWLSHPCHKRKTQHETQTATQRKRTPEPHPGRLT